MKASFSTSLTLAEEKSSRTALSGMAFLPQAHFCGRGRSGGCCKLKCLKLTESEGNSGQVSAAKHGVMKRRLSNRSSFIRL